MSRCFVLNRKAAFELKFVCCYYFVQNLGQVLFCVIIIYSQELDTSKKKLMATYKLVGRVAKYL